LRRANASGFDFLQKFPQIHLFATPNTHEYKPKNLQDY
jgi:hypothetical protein